MKRTLRYFVILVTILLLSITNCSNKTLKSDNMGVNKPLIEAIKKGLNQRKLMVR